MRIIRPGDHNEDLHRRQATVPDGMTVQQIVKVLRCSSPGSHDATIRIVYTAAGGFEYGGTTPDA